MPALPPACGWGRAASPAHLTWAPAGQNQAGSDPRRALLSQGGVTHGWIPPMEAFRCTVQGPGTLWPWHRVLPARLCLLEVPDQSCRLPLQNGAGAAATLRLFPSLPSFPLSSQPLGSVRAF